MNFISKMPRRNELNKKKKKMKKVLKKQKKKHTFCARALVAHRQAIKSVKLLQKKNYKQRFITKINKKQKQILQMKIEK